MTTPPIVPRRRVPIGRKPASDPSSAWIRQIDAPDAPDAWASASVYTARLTIDVTPALRGRITSTAFERGVTASDMPRELLERAFSARGGVTQPEPDGLPHAVQRWPRTVPASRLTRSHVSLAFVAHRLNVWPRLGTPARKTILDRWQCVAAVVRSGPGGRARWSCNAYRTALSTRMVREAPAAIDGADDRGRTGGAMCCARILWRVDGAKHVGAVCNRIQAIEASGTVPCAVATDCRRIIANRLAAHPPLPEFAVDPCAVRHARGAPQ